MASIEDLRLDVEELKHLLEKANRKRVVTLLESEIRTLSDQISRKNLAEENSATATPKAPPVYRTKIDLYSYGQTDKFLNIYVSDKLKDLKNIPSENVTTQFTNRTVHLEVKDLSNRIYFFDITNLAYEIVPESCNHKIKSDSIVLNLRKKKEGNEWECVTALEKASKDKKKEKLSDDVDMKGDPSAGLMGIMKKMYEEGDDEMKKTIAKTWYESSQKQGKGLDPSSMMDI